MTRKVIEYMKAPDSLKQKPAKTMPEPECLLKLPVGPIVVLDIESGGFDVKRNPLLSVGVVYGSDTDIVDWKTFHIRPPTGTWLELPVHEDQLKGKKDKRIEAWLEVSTGQQIVPRPEPPPFLIKAEAAEINGFVNASETIPGWDLTTMTEWGDLSYAEATEALNAWLSDHPAQAVVAHNAAFDKRFMDEWLPHVKLPGPWHCTQVVFKKAFNGGQQKGSSVGAVCKLAGYTPEVQLHTEIGDCVATYHIWRWLRGKGL